MSRFWHGFADMHLVRDRELIMSSGDGIWITDTAGRRYLDATAALWYCSVGHGRTAIASAAAYQMGRLAAYSSFGSYTTDVTLALANRLAGLSPINDAVVFLTSGGSDAIETAAKLVRRYWQAIGKPRKQVIVAREHSYHGMHAWGTSLVGIPAMREGYGDPIVDQVVHVGAMDTEGLADLFERKGAEIAAFVGEPVIGAGGVIPPEPWYWPEVQRLCRKHDVLLIADEVITGFGRLGRMWGSQRYDIEPDVVTFAKGVTSGYAPLGGVLVGPRVAGPFWEQTTGAIFRHGYTYSGHSTACAVALANLDMIEDEKLVGRVEELEPFLAASLRRLEGAPLVDEIRTVGLTGAVAIRPDSIADRPTIVEEIVAAALDRGIATRVLRGHALHISPPFVITPTEIDVLVDGLAAALDHVAYPG